MTKVKVGLGCLLELLKKDPIVKIVSELPPKETAELNFIYLVPKDNAGQDKRAYVLRPDRSGYDAIDLSPQVIDVVGEGLITVKKEVHNENGDVTFTVTTSPSFQAVLDSLTAKDKELDTKVSALEAKDAVHEAKLSAIEAKDSEQDTKLEALKAHDDQVDDALEAVGKTIEKTVDLIDAKVLELKKDNERQDGALDDLGESVKDLNESVQHLDEEHGKAIADLQKDSQDMKELTSELDNSINEINDQLKLLDGGLEEEVKAIHTEVGDITNAVTEIENRTDKLAKDAEDKSKAQAEKDSSQDTEIEALKKKDAEVETALETLGETLGKTVDLIDHKAQGLDTRVKALEAKEDLDKQTLAIAGNKLSISNGNEVDLPQYDDTSVKDAINHLGDGLNQAMDYTEQVKNYVDSKADALTLVLGTAKADADAKNEALTNRVHVLEEAKPVVENKLTEIEAKNTAQDEKITALENRTDNFINNVTVSKEAGKVKLTYSRVDGSSSEVEFEDSDTVTLAYDDEPLKTRIKALEDKEDKDTIYNDTEVKQGIKANENAIQGVENDLTALRTHTDARIEALENKEDKDTIYDDSAVRGKITALESNLDEISKHQEFKNTDIETRIDNLERKEDRDNQTLTLDDHTLSISGGNSVTLPEYDDSALKASVEELKSKDTELSDEINKLKVKTDNDNQAHDIKDTELDNRIRALETKEDNDKQTLSLTDHTLSISNGNSVELPKYDDTVVKAKNTEQDEELKALKEKTKSFLTGASVTRQGNVVTLTYTNIDGTSTNLEFNDNDTKAIAYDDTALKARVQELENKTDKDTVYDDAEVKKLIQANKDSIATTDNMVDKHENKINTLTTDVEALKTKPDKDTIYDDSAVTARLTALENKPEVEYELVKTTKNVDIIDSLSIIGLSYENTDDLLKEYTLVVDTVFKIKSPFSSSNSTINSRIGFNSGVTGDNIQGSSRVSIGDDAQVEFFYSESTMNAYLVYEPENENEVVKYRKQLSLAELQGTEPARISISKGGVEQGYVEATFTGFTMKLNSYKVQKKG